MLPLPKLVHDQMVAHCLAGLPDEACGLLGGDPETGEVVTCYPTRNLAASAKLYTVDPKDHLRADRDAEAAGNSIIGVFHSHTHTEAYPSPDRRGPGTRSDLALRAGVASGHPAGGPELPDRGRRDHRGAGHGCSPGRIPTERRQLFAAAGRIDARTQRRTRARPSQPADRPAVPRRRSQDRVRRGVHGGRGPRGPGWSSTRVSPARSSTTTGRSTSS